MKRSIIFLVSVLTIGLITLTSMKMSNQETTSYLAITLDIKEANRANAAAVYLKYKNPFLKQIKGATSKELLLRTEDVQVLHGFENESDAQAYLTSELFQADVVRELKPYLESNPEIRVYSLFQP